MKSTEPTNDATQVGSRKSLLGLEGNVAMSKHEGPEKPQQALRRRMPTVYTMDDKSHVYVYVYNPVGDEQRLENTQSPYSYTHHALTVGEGGFSFIWTIVTRHRYT